jgi:hypothetical protein
VTDDIYEDKGQSTDDQKYGDPEDSTAAKLLTLPEKEAAETAYKLWKEQPQAIRNKRRCEQRVNKMRREGMTNVHVVKDQDRATYKVYIPPFNAPPIPVLNKSDRLCRRLTAQVWADDPVAEVQAGTQDTDDQDAAEFDQRVLTDIQGEGKLDELRRARRAFDRAGTFGSGYIRYYLDPKGGGRQPVRVHAKPGAVSADQPFLGPNGEPLPGDLVLRFVTADGTLTDDEAQAATRWMPGLKSENLDESQVRLIPHDAEDIWDSEGVVIGTMRTWGEMLRDFPELAKTSEDDRKHVFSFKPEHPKDLVGLDHVKDRLNEDGKVRDEDRLVPVFIVYYEACPAYPEGCHFVGIGDRLMAHRDKWVGDVEGKRQELDIPLTQYMQFDGGLGLMDLLGNASEARAAMVGHIFTYMDQFINRKTYVPTNSILQGKSNQLMMGSHLAINPGGEPKHEEIPPLPTTPLDLFAIMTEEMNDHAMLGETAQGTEVPSVTSGRQAQVIVQQAQAGLSDLRQNTERAYIRSCRIQLQLIRVGYTVPQQMDWVGEDGAHKQRYWTGSDLSGSRDVRLKRGSLSMMTPEQKMTMAFQFQQAGLYQANPDMFYDAVASSLGPTVGLNADVHKNRMKRQLAQWSEGPPEGWQPQPAPMMADPMTGQPMPAIDPMTGQPMPPPPDPALMAIFDFLAVDELQDVAMSRLAELKRFMASTKYTRHPVEWRLGVDTEFERMKQAAGVMTVMEQQAMMAQQQAMQQQQQQAEGEQQGAEKDKDRQAKAESQQAQQQHEQALAQMPQAA